jgi:DNA-binding CsgD family transcriptional regulator
MSHQREREILDLLLRGYSNPAIASALEIRVRTVKAYLSKLFFRYGIEHDDRVDNRGARIKLAVRATYERHPSLVPFCNGDRAANLGFQSARDYVADTAARSRTETFSHDDCDIGLQYV